VALIKLTYTLYQLQRCDYKSESLPESETKITKPSEDSKVRWFGQCINEYYSQNELWLKDRKEFQFPYFVCRVYWISAVILCLHSYRKLIFIKHLIQLNMLSFLNITIMVMHFPFTYSLYGIIIWKFLNLKTVNIYWTYSKLLLNFNKISFPLELFELHK
jgi:hypothetical protein